MIAKIILILLMTLSLGMGLANHGRERSKQNGFTSLASYILMIVILYFSDFFN